MCTYPPTKPGALGAPSGKSLSWSESLVLEIVMEAIRKRSRMWRGENRQVAMTEASCVIPAI